MAGKCGDVLPRSYVQGFSGFITVAYGIAYARRMI